MKDMKEMKVKKMKLFQWWGQAFFILIRACIINPGPGKELFGLWVLRAPGLFSLAAWAWKASQGLRFKV